MLLLLVAAAGLLVAMALMILRAIMGPSVYDRILAGNSFGSKTVLFIALIGSLFGMPVVLIDIAIVYSLINFITTIALMKFFRYRSLQAPLSKIGAADNG